MRATPPEREGGGGPGPWSLRGEGGAGEGGQRCSPRPRQGGCRRGLGRSLDEGDEAGLMGRCLWGLGLRGGRTNQSVIWGGGGAGGGLAGVRGLGYVCLGHQEKRWGRVPLSMRSDWEGLRGVGAGG